MDEGRHVVHPCETAIIQRFLLAEKLWKQLLVTFLYFAEI